MTTRIPISIPVQPWFRDHHFNEKVIFPAVEIMLFLTKYARDIRPDIHPENMTGASFSKFLEIPPGAAELPALLEYDDNGDALCLKLLSKIQLKTMSRIKEHAEIGFSFSSEESTPVEPITVKSTDLLIDAERIYRELVPFGPTYRSLTGELHISSRRAWSSLQAPLVTRQHEMEKEIGSPFPLDGAMHAPLSGRQCLADFVPFPTGFAQRYIHKATRPGEAYSTTIIPVSMTENELVFNLSIFDTERQPCETVKGLRMQDVSGGAITPPKDLPRPTIFPH